MLAGGSGLRLAQGIDLGVMHPIPHLLRVHQFHALEPGPRLIVLGSVHGNETCGTHAMARLLPQLDDGSLALVRGMLTLVPITNALAHQNGLRVGDRNLNRNLYPTTSPRDHEDRLGNVLCPLLAAHGVLLDLHSFHTGGEPFAMIGPPDNTGPLEPFARAREEQALALRLGVNRIVEGWLDTYARGVARRVADSPALAQDGSRSTDPRYGVGTTEYMRTQGGCAITLECGQHDDLASRDVAYRAIMQTLAHLKMIDAPDPAPVAAPEFLRLTEVVDRAAPGDTLARAWASYDPLRAGDIIGHRANGTPLVAPADGYIVFPNPKARPGDEWYYLAQRSTRSLG
jgi:predicted deacylase